MPILSIQHMKGFGLPVRQAILASYLLLQEAELGTDAHDLTACLCLDLLLSKGGDQLLLVFLLSLSLCSYNSS